MSSVTVYITLGGKNKFDFSSRMRGPPCEEILLFDVSRPDTPSDIIPGDVAVVAHEKTEVGSICHPG